MPNDDGPVGDPKYVLPHLDISRFRQTRDYLSTSSGSQGHGPLRQRRAHADKLLRELQQARAQMDESAFRVSDTFKGGRGTALEVETAPGGKLPDLEKKNADIRVGAVKTLPLGGQQALLVMPEEGLLFWEQRIESYRDKDTPKGNPRFKTEVESLEHFRIGRLEAFWTDDRPLPKAEETIWWECWCWPDRVDNLLRACERGKVRVSQQRLFFPNLTVLMVLGDREEIQQIVGTSFAVSELRRASDTPHFFVKDSSEANLWVEELAERIVPPSTGNASVCILDTGLNRAHPLLESATADEDCHAIDKAWGVDDHHGHGTNMAGLVLYGNLAPLLGSSSPIAITHRLESVKILPPKLFEPTEPENYASLTRSAVALPEIQAPKRRRVFCMAVSNEDVSGERPTSWSSSIDQLAAGADLTDMEEPMRRLFVLSAGNIPDAASYEEMSDSDEFPVEDPCQAWNALTIGGMTDLTEIDPEEGLPGWSPFAAAGEKSPYSRCSTDWRQGRTPIKPELVLEAGNRAVSPSKGEISSGVDSLSLLTTCNDGSGHLLETFWATSAAAGQAAAMAGALLADNQDLWPETIRALLVHSASWSPAMAALLGNRNKSERHQLLRQFGFGIPDLAKAIRSARSDVALVAQSAIQPYCRRPSRGAAFKDCHLYDLPWPLRRLEELGSQDVELKVTLSYFIEPAPGQFAPVRPDRYRSAGLRFDLKRTGEPFPEFLARKNKLDQEEEELGEYPDPRWILPPSVTNAGSMHTNTWIGPAAELLDRNALVIHPVMGWWRERPSLGKLEQSLPYALVVSLRSRETDIDLYSEIEAVIAIASEAAAEAEVQV